MDPISQLQARVLERSKNIEREETMRMIEETREQIAEAQEYLQNLENHAKREGFIPEEVEASEDVATPEITDEELETVESEVEHSPEEVTHIV